MNNLTINVFACDERKRKVLLFCFNKCNYLTKLNLLVLESEMSDDYDDVDKKIHNYYHFALIKDLSRKATPTDITYLTNMVL